MNDIWISIILRIVKTISIVYDAISFLPAYFIERPDLLLQNSKRLKAKTLVFNDPSSPFRTLLAFDKLTSTPYEGCSTMDDLYELAVRKFATNLSLGTREILSEEDEKQPNGKIFKKAILGQYKWLTYGEVEKRVRNLASGLLHLHQNELGDRNKNICIYADTRAEWIISIFSCFKINFPVVTLYSTLGEAAIAHGINETEVSIVITTQESLPTFVTISSKIPNVKHIVYMESAHPSVTKVTSIPGIQLHAMNKLELIGEKMENIEVLEKHPRAKPDDMALIMYTSGSTGTPKGVMMSNSNLLHGMSGQIQRVPNLGPEDVYVGYLPLAHVLELTAEISCFIYGTRIGFSSPTTLSDQSTGIKKGCKGDVSILRPTLMTAVPLIMDRLYKAVWEKINEGGQLQRELFKFAYEYKKKKYEAGFSTPLCDKMIFKKTRQLLGGRVRIMLSGGAPLSNDTQRFMNICFCCPIIQGYGLTETCGAGSVSEDFDRSTGRVGSPLQCNDIMLVDWEEGNYHVSDRPFPRGEVWIGGGNIALGYYNDPAKTALEFHEKLGKRWFSTGDIGLFEADGSLRIIDRKKDLVKLQVGEYVSLAKVEMLLKLSPLVENVCVYADSSKMFTVCLIVPNQKHVELLARSIGKLPVDWPYICEDEDVIAAALKTLQDICRKGKLEKFEIPQRLTMVTDVWTPDTGLVTEAFKLRRKNIETLYLKDIIRMYA